MLIFNHIPNSVLTHFLIIAVKLEYGKLRKKYQKLRGPTSFMDDPLFDWLLFRIETLGYSSHSSRTMGCILLPQKPKPSPPQPMTSFMDDP